MLTLYDTLRELEGEFLVKYMQNNNEEIDEDPKDIIKTESIPSPQQLMMESIKSEPEEPSGWSMSLTSNGLSLQAVTRNLSEFNDFAKIISRQIMRDFGPEYLPSMWDPDAEGYFQEDSDAEELAEDEYLVTIPVFSTCDLLCSQKNPNVIADKAPVIIEEKEELINAHLRNMIQHLETRYQSLDEQSTDTNTSHHLVILMLQLKLFLPLSKPYNDNLLTRICILTAYVVSVTLLPPIPNTILAPLPTSLWRDCAEHATMLLIDLILQNGDSTPSYPIILCAILLGWIDTEYTFYDFKADTMIHIALRILCGSDWQKEEPAWQLLIATLLYLDIYSATFRFKRPQLCGEGVGLLWKAAVKMRAPEEKWETSFREAGIVLEARLMSLLNRVISLFYHVEHQDVSVTRKIDVDEVLTLVRDTELWEQELPNWARWNTETKSKRIGLKMHMHMIYNIVKILLFRPFSITVKEEEQTFTKTTFLDMSICSADRLTSCLFYEYEGYWTKAASRLVRDVSERVLQLFDKDEDIVDQLDKIQTRLQQAEILIKGKNSI